MCAPWAQADDVGDCSAANIDPSQVIAKLPAASDLLYRMSGHQWSGSCTSTVRPVRHCGCGPVALGVADGWWIPDGVASTLAVNNLCGHPAMASRSIVLPGRPVTAISEVRIDGQVLAADAYRVDDWEVLVRQDGGQWPSLQLLDRPAGEVGTWSVTYEHGANPPASGVDAAVALATELAKGCAGGECALPERAVRAVRQGVEFDLEPADLLSEGRTGIQAVDLFLRAVNPHQLAQGASVRSPGMPRHTVTT